VDPLRVMAGSPQAASSTSTPAVVQDAFTAPEQQRFSLWQRIQLFFITWGAYLLLCALCSTLEFTYSWEEPAEADSPGAIIHPFWHRCIIPAAYQFRGRGVGVMTSSSFDGEYIARIIEKLGFRAVRGSSRRGAVSALRGMHREIEAGHPVAFTIDGPTGPRYVAKPGPVALARNTQAPIQCFYIALDRAWVLNSWDALVVPKPFARAHACAAKMIRIPRTIEPSALQDYHAAMQAALERVRERAEAEVKLKGA